MRNRIEIRNMEERDVEFKAIVHYQTWKISYQGLINQKVLEDLDFNNCLRISRNNIKETIVAICDDKVVGFGSYGKNRLDSTEKSGEIIAMYVLPGYQRRGVGLALMKECLRRLKNYDKVYLWVLSNNFDSIKFYEYCGFKIDNVSVNKKIAGLDYSIDRMLYQKNNNGL